jgi:hypothetical protein
MTNTPQIPAGWFPDPSGGPGQRWWDGSQWSEHFSDVPHAGATGTTAVASRPAPTGTTTPFILVFVLVPLLSVIALIFFDFHAYVDASLDPTAGPLAQFTPAYLLLTLLGWVVYGLSALFAALDWRELKKRGVERPFHWAWTFLSSLAYIIGRTVILRRRGKGEGAMLPLFIAIGVTVLGAIIGIVKTIDVIGYIVSELSYLYN